MGTWSGSVSDMLSSADPLELEKIKDDWVNHSNWELLGGEAMVVDGVADNESGVDGKGDNVPEGKVTEVPLGDAIEEANCADSEGGLVLTGGFEEERHPMPSKAHKSPVVLGSG